MCSNTGNYDDLLFTREGSSIFDERHLTTIVEISMVVVLRTRNRPRDLSLKGVGGVV